MLSFLVTVTTGLQVILFWLNGGPRHIDAFDLKLEACAEFPRYDNYRLQVILSWLNGGLSLGVPGRKPPSFTPNLERHGESTVCNARGCHGILHQFEIRLQRQTIVIIQPSGKTSELQIRLRSSMSCVFFDGEITADSENRFKKSVELFCIFSLIYRRLNGWKLAPTEGDTLRLSGKQGNAIPKKWHDHKPRTVLNPVVAYVVPGVEQL